MTFRLPIEYRKCFPVQPSMVADLELVTTQEPGGTSMYDCLFAPKSEHAKAMVGRWALQFTDDAEFLEQTVTLVKKVGLRPFDAAPFIKEWREHHQTTEFNTLYHYVEYSKLEFLNTIPMALLVMSLYSMLTPVLFLLSPIMILLIPFALLKISNKTVGWAEYREALGGVLRKHALGAIFMTRGASPNQCFYMAFTAVLFCTQMYANVQSCLQFYKSVQKVQVQ